jgi:hypothetical protein
MVQTCSRCARVNPDEASYCYYDGVALGGHRGNGAPVNTGVQPFPLPFTFPSGKTCRNFDQLGLGCQEQWSEALELLQQGYLESFLGSLGRADLARAAREAARVEDRDRGLDEFLAKLPTDVVEGAKLEVEPTIVNLGVLRPHEDRQWELHLANKGMRLLYGSVACDDCLWLAVGDSPGAPQKWFQFTTETDVLVHVRGKHLRAGPQPVEGRLLTESNGGSITVLVRAEVPVKPYPDGLLAGARTPRQLAEKAKASPKEAAALFESGAVAQWYRDNGWIYPVQGPVASDMGAVQQFFEALGLTKPPKIEVSVQSVTLAGNVGVELCHLLKVRTEENRPVYAHGVSDQPWLEVGRARLSGRVATLPLVVPAVPDCEGETLQATVNIVANGNQRFTIPVTLEVGGNLNFTASSPALPPPIEHPVPPPEQPVNAVLPQAAGPGVKASKEWLHAIPAVMLILALAVVVLRDIGDSSKSRRVTPSDGNFPNLLGRLEDPEPRIGVKFNSSMRFGILMLQERDPLEPEKFKRLTMAEDGWSNNTCIRLDGHENLFGLPPGDWAVDETDHQSLKEVKLKNNPYGRMSTWSYDHERVIVRQTVEVVPGEQTRVLDTCLVHYLVENRDTIPHKVGLRVMLDTFIGSSDGVPFVVPGQPGLLETMQVFDQKTIPDAIEALEQPDLKNPGTIARMGLKLQGVKILRSDPDLDPVERLVICRWPEYSEKRWKWDYQPMNADPQKKDSCVVLYWEDETLKPGSRRAMAFTYGLGRMSSGSGQLGLTVNGSFRPGKVFTVTAYVKDPKEGQKVKLHLPRGLAIDKDQGEQTEEQTVEVAKDYSQVSWRVRAANEGTFVLKVSSGLDEENHTVRVRGAGLFD